MHMACMPFRMELTKNPVQDQNDTSKKRFTPSIWRWTKVSYNALLKAVDISMETLNKKK